MKIAQEINIKKIPGINLFAIERFRRGIQTRVLSKNMVEEVKMVEEEVRYACKQNKIWVFSYQYCS